MLYCGGPVTGAAFEKATREQKIRNEMTQAKRDEEFYMDRVKQGLAIEAMESKVRLCQLVYLASLV